ncbi:MAG TPA: Rieske (2Fe-2S) protein [Sporichthyaceae bacterium]|nr:Rieske (2Fe-2S) protein [Sporichthyaceae bacterium]
MIRCKADVDRMVEAVLAGQAIRAGELGPEDAEVLRAAIELRAARPGAGVPSEEFLTRLRRDIEVASTGSEVVVDLAGRGFSRRSVLAVAAALAGAGAVGGVVEHTLSTGSAPPAQAAGPSGSVVGKAGSWVQVASGSDLASGASQRFVTADAVGFVTVHEGRLMAVSGACTHLGCLLRDNAPAGRLDCPCHRTSFAPDGTVVFSQLSTHPAPLPTYRVRERESAVEVYVPTET